MAQAIKIRQEYNNQVTKIINIDNWQRKRQYEFFRQLDYPHFNICTNLDISKAHRYSKEQGISLFKTILYVTIKTANDIPEFRCRIREDQIVEHDIIRPSFTVSVENDQFSFCTVNYAENVKKFFAIVNKGIERVKQHPLLIDEPDRDDLVYISCLPWISFTGVMHPIHMHPVDSIPRIAWGKYIHEGDSVKLPYSLQAHHALADGFHAGKFFNLFQGMINQPEYLFKT